jgi:hypothetical protein
MKKIKEYVLDLIISGKKKGRESLFEINLTELHQGEMIRS